MSAKKAQPLPRKHVPQRTCIACRRVQGKRSLIRIVRTEVEGVARVAVDATGKQGGRGCYLHPNQECWQIALKSGRIEQALRVRLNAEDRAALIAHAQTLPPTEDASEAETVQ